MRFEELNWFDIERYLHTENRLMLILGACEQHGYLSLASDVKIPLALADAASQQTGVLVAPPIYFGASPYFLNYPGTLSLRITTLLDIIEDIVRSAYSHGFRKILILNGHGGNDPARLRLYEIANVLSDLHIAWYSWWQAHSIEAIAQKHDLHTYHGGWIEAFPFTKVTDLPQGTKTPPHIPGLLGSEQTRQIYGDGVFGGQYQVDDMIMDEIFQTALADIIQILRFE
jgi:creatinine amidohydrolase